MMATSTRSLSSSPTIPLEPGDKGYKKSLVERLSRAARDHLADSNEPRLSY